MQDDDVVLTCARCGATARIADAVDWTARFEEGKLAELYCADCSTAEEHVEGQVNVSMLEFDVNGEVDAHPKP